MLKYASKSMKQFHSVGKQVCWGTLATKQLSMMMAPWMYLLLASLIPPTWAASPTRRPGGRKTPPIRRPGEEDSRGESGRRGRELLSSSSAPTTKVLDFSLDIDQEPDSNGSYTRATLEKEDLPPSFTICAAHMVEAWTTEFSGASMLLLKNEVGDTWANVFLHPSSDYTEYDIFLGPAYLIATTAVFFPLQWIRFCVSLDTNSAMVRLVVDGQVLGQEEYKVEEDRDRPSNLAMFLGTSKYNKEDTGQVSSLNMFSSALSLERMMGMTTAGGEECGAHGDYLSWEETEWTLHSATRMLEVEAREGPCRRKNKVQVFTADFEYHADCMEHCQKFHGRSPPARVP